MNVDKTRFMLLTAALSAATVVGVGASGCTINSTTTNTGDSGTPSGPDGGLDTDSGSGDSDGGTEDADAAPPCLDDTGEAGDCSTLTGTSCAEGCEVVSAQLKKGVTRDVVECLSKLTTCIDEGGAPTPEVTACLDAAAAKTCEDPTVATTCEPLVTTCTAEGANPTFTQEACEKALRTKNEAGREAFVTCVTEGVADNCSSDPTFCFL